MFYATQVKSVSGGSAVDVNGRILQFIGYMQVQAGDTVYTDGRFIFGNAPPKGGSVLFDELKGIPVLGDKYLLSAGGDELRGYFTSKGKYKKFKIAGNDWITNNKKKFAHGKEKLDGEIVIDADITDDGDELVVTNGIYQDSHPLTSTFVLARVNDYRLFYFDRLTWKKLHVLISLINGSPFAVIEQILGSEDFSAKQTPVKIFVNGTANVELDLAPFAENVKQRALACAEQIMAQSYTDTTSDLTTFLVSAGTSNLYATYSYSTPEIITSYKNFRTEPTEVGVYPVPAHTVEGPAKPPPDSPVIVCSNAHVLTSNVGDKGFDGVIFAAAYGYCFPHIRPRFTFYYLDGNLEHNRDTFAKIYEWKCVPFGFAALYRVTEGVANFEPLAARAFGGVDCDLPATEGDVAFLTSPVYGPFTGDGITSVREYRHVEMLPSFKDIDFGDDTFLPVGDGFYRMDKFGRLTFYDSQKNIVAEDIPVHEDFYHVEVAHGEFIDDFVAPTFNNKPNLACKIYTSDGKVKDATIVFNGNDITDSNKAYDDNKSYIRSKNGIAVEISAPPMDGYYIKDSTGILEPLRFTPLFYELKDGSYLYGVKDGALYKVDGSGNVEKVGEGIKNFRLRELRKMSKAKK